MGLSFYNASEVLLDASNPVRARHDGRLGGADEQLLYINNDDPTVYYTDLSIVLESDGSYDELGEYGSSGWSFKFHYGERQPTEAEWDVVRSGEAIDLPDIGTIDTADTSTYLPVWLRVYAPGNIGAQYRTGYRIVINGYPKLLGT